LRFLREVLTDFFVRLGGVLHEAQHEENWVRGGSSKRWGHLSSFDFGGIANSDVGEREGGGKGGGNVCARTRGEADLGWGRGWGNFEKRRGFRWTLNHRMSERLKWGGERRIRMEEVGGCRDRGGR